MVFCRTNWKNSYLANPRQSKLEVIDCQIKHILQNELEEFLYGKPKTVKTESYTDQIQSANMQNKLEEYLCRKTI